MYDFKKQIVLKDLQRNTPLPLIPTRDSHSLEAISCNSAIFVMNASIFINNRLFAFSWFFFLVWNILYWLLFIPPLCKICKYNYIKLLWSMNLTVFFFTSEPHNVGNDNTFIKTLLFFLELVFISCFHFLVFD